MDANAEQRLRLQITGLVQGVGFRPRVHTLATQLRLTGWVRNSPGGVELMLEGPPEQLQRFLTKLQNHPPPHSRIDRITQQWSVAHRRQQGFRILAPWPAAPAQGVASAAISPDLAICRHCLRELADAGNRRHRYPFISCTNCGPRYSLLRHLPFERAHTSLCDWPLCAACRREYNDPRDRRFHAQTLSCPACGPRLRWQAQGAGRASAAAAIGPGDHHNDSAIAAAAAALRRGQIVAVQGIGGFQLLVDPCHSAAVAELRRRKGRPDKPLALLASSAWLERSCRLTPRERELWWSAAAPILLLLPQGAAQQPSLAAGVTAGSPWLGVMRAASGLQQLLLEACNGVLVATSANRSGEPIAADAEQDSAVLAELADGVLSHGLQIVNRIDDSVLRLAAGRPLVLRLGRGLAPLTLPISTAEPATAALALGAQSKGGLAVRLPQAVVLSPDLGDLSSRAGGRHLQATAAAWLERHQLTPEAIHCDAHPGYSASQLAAALAEERQRPLQRVQHHHAHLLAVMAEHGLRGEQIGVAWDGSGQGDDGQLWGGEALAVHAAGYRRLARLRPFPLPGGERAQREPRRAALGLLLSAWPPPWQERADAGAPPAWLAAFRPDELMLLVQASQRGLNSPWCSSAGRLFDAVAALLGVQQHCSFEGQAALALEALAMQAEADPAAQAIPQYQLPLHPGEGAVPWEWDWRPLIAALLRDAGRSNHSTAAIALGVHRALAAGIAELAARLQPPTLLLSGGCFQNRVLLESTVAALQRQGRSAHWPQRLPCNDAALAVGQLLSPPRCL